MEGFSHIREGAFDRSAELLGEAAMGRLADMRILIVGVGGVGGWCAEALVRTGARRLTLMDDDVVATSNLNRQCPATVPELGLPKVDAMQRRLAAINPGAEVVALRERYLPDCETVPLSGFDIVVDAIDSVDCKASLILDSFQAGVGIVSSMGAAFRLDPARVRTTRFEKVEGDGLAKALRGRFRKIGRYPGRFECVWSDESPSRPSGGGKGSLMQVTSTFGMHLAAAVVKAAG